MRWTQTLPMVLLLGVATACVPDAVSDTVAKNSVTVTAQFRDAAGLYSGNDVRVLGLKVGFVSSIEPNGDYVEVELELDADVPVPADAHAVTVAPSIVTDRHVELVPAYTSGATLAAGEVIPVERTRTPVELDQVARAAVDLADALAEQDGVAPIGDLAAVSGSLVGGNGKKFRRMLEQASEAVEFGVENREEVTGLVRGIDRLMAAARRNDDRINAFSQRLTTATELFAAEGPHLRRTLREALKLLTTADAVLVENRKNIKQSLENFATTTDTAASRQRELSETADLLPLLFSNAARIIDPEKGAMRAHGLSAQSLFQTELVKYLCPYAPLLPVCQNGQQTRDLGADGGLTELLVGGVQ